MTDFIWLILIIAALPVGVVFGYFLRRSLAFKQAESVEAKAKEILDDAKNKEKELLYKAREKAIKVLDEVKHEEETRRRELAHAQARLEKRESLFDKKLLELEDRGEKLQEKAKKIEEIREEIQKIKQKDSV